MRTVVAVLVGCLSVVPFLACDDGPATSSSPPAPDSGTTTTGETSDASTCEKTLCGADCVEIQTDRKHCGGCGKKCENGEICRASTCVAAIGFAVRKLFFGETDRSGTKSPDAWKAYGRDIDGVDTTNAGTETCKRVAGASASSVLDGPGGLDNAFGRNILSLLEPFAPTPSKNITVSIEAGARTPMIQLIDWKGGDATPVVSRFVYAEAGALPKWDGSDEREVTHASPENVFANGTLQGGAFTSGSGLGSFLLEVAGLGPVALTVPVKGLRVTMKLSSDGTTATEGIISGVIAEKDLEEAIAKNAGAFNQDLCSGSTIEGFRSAIKQSADILMDGTQDPTKECDGITIGLGFEAVLVTVGDQITTPDPATPDPCQP